MRRPRLLVLAVGLLVAGLVLALGARAAHAGGDEPLGDGKLARVKLGWEGFVPRDTVGPVSVTITNPENRERTLRVVVTPWDSENAEETITVPALGKRRVAFALRIQAWVTVSISEGSKLLARGTFTGSQLPDHAVLLVDGDPDTLQVPEVATGCIVVSVRPEELPTELACLARFNGVVLRHVDPTRFEPRARAALDDLVRAGGTVVVVAPDDRAGVRAFFEEVDPATETRPGPGSAAVFPTRRKGLGVIARVGEDVGANMTGAQSQARAALGALLLVTKHVPFPRAHLGEHPNDSATNAGVLLGGFLLVYIVVAGPVFAFAMRRRKAIQVVRAFGVVLAVFVLLGALTAVAVRGGSGVVRVFSFIVVPPSGDAVVFADVTIQSAGRRTQDVTIEGDDVAATSFGRTGRRLFYRPWGEELRTWHTEAALTERAVGRHAVSFPEHAVPSFGETSIGVVAAARTTKRIPAEVTIQRGRVAEVTITNTLDHDLGPLLVCERLPRRGVWEFARADRLAKGATLKLPLQRTGSLSTSLLKIPPSIELVGWLDVTPPAADGTLSRFVLYAEEPAPLVVKTPGARLEQRSWRVQDVDSPVSNVAGWLGLAASKTQRGLKITAVTPGSPAARVGWMLSPGRVITTVAGQPVRSLDDLKRVLVSAGPGTVVKIITDDNRQVDVELGDVPAKPQKPDDEDE